MKKRTSPATNEPKRVSSFSYYRGSMSAAQPRAERLEQRSSAASFVPKFKWQILPSLIAASLVVGAFMYNLYLSSNPIMKLADDAVLIRNEKDYQTGVSGVLSSSITNKSKLLINTSHIESEIIKVFPEISKAAVSVPLVGNQLVVGASFDRPSFVVAADNGHRYIISQSGKVILEDVRMPDLITLEDASGLKYELGKRVFTPDDIRFLEYVFEESKASGHQIAQVKTGLTPRDLEVKFEGYTWYAKLNYINPPDKQMGALWAALDYMESERRVPSEYIDVRLHDRVFIK